MHTQLKIFDLPPKGLSAEGSKTAARLSGREKDPASDQLTGFLEVMGAMLNLETAQPENSLEPVDTITALEDETGQLPFIIDSGPQDVEPSELIQMLWNLNNAVDTPPPNSEGAQQGDLFMDLARALINDQMQDDGESAPLPDGDENENLKAKWFQILNQLKTSPQAEQSETTVMQDAVSDKSAAGRLFGNLAQKIEIEKTDGGAGADVETTTPDRAFNGFMRHFFKENGGVSASSQGEDAPPQVGERQTATAGIKPFSGEKPDINAEIGKTAETANHFNSEKQSQTDGEALSREAFQKPVPSEDPSSLDGDEFFGKSFQRASADPIQGSHHGDFSRLSLKSDQGVTDLLPNRESVPLDKESQSDVIRQIVQRMSINTQGSQSKMVIRLKPAFLGNVHLQVLTENQQVTVRMTADSLAVKEIVEQNLQHLKNELQHHGLEIQKFDVFVGNDNQGWKNGQEQAGFRQALRQRQQRPDGNKKNIKDDSGLSAVETQNTLKDPSEINYFA